MDLDTQICTLIVISPHIQPFLLHFIENLWCKPELLVLGFDSGCKALVLI